MSDPQEHRQLIQEMASLMGRRPGVAVLVGARDILGRDYDAQWLSDAAAKLEPNHVARRLTRLSRAFEDGADTPQAQFEVADAWIPHEPVRSDLLGYLSNGNEPRMWFNTPTSLFGLRVLGEAHRCSETVTGGEACELTEFSEWLLAVGQEVAAHTGGVADEGFRDRMAWLAWEVQNWHLYARRDTFNAIVRTAVLFFGDLKEHLPSDAEEFDLTGELSRLLPIPPKLYAQISMLIHSQFMHEATVRYEAFTGHWGDTELTWDDLSAVLDDLTMPLRQIGTRTIETARHAGKSAFNTLPFLKSPLIRLPDGGHACPSIGLLAEHAYNRFYFALHDELLNRECSGANRFTRCWGNLIHAYVEALFSEAVACQGPLATAWFARTEPKYNRGQDEIPDVAVLGPSRMLFFEVSSTTLTAPAMFRGDTSVLEDDLEKALIKKAKQLDHAIEAYIDRRFELGRHVHQGDELVVPVIVTTGFRPIQPPSHRYLISELQRRDLLQQEVALPLQVLSLGDLEFLMNLSASGQMIWDLLSRKAVQERRSPRTSFVDWIHQEKIAAPTKHHPLLARTFREFFGEIQENLFGLEGAADGSMIDL